MWLRAKPKLAAVSDKRVVTQTREAGLTVVTASGMHARVRWQKAVLFFWSHLSASQIACFKKGLQEDLNDTEDFQLSTDQSQNQFAYVLGRHYRAF